MKLREVVAAARARGGCGRAAEAARRARATPGAAERISPAAGAMAMPLFWAARRGLEVMAERGVVEELGLLEERGKWELSESQRAGAAGQYVTSAIFSGRVQEEALTAPSHDA